MASCWGALAGRAEGSPPHCGPCPASPKLGQGWRRGVGRLQVAVRAPLQEPAGTRDLRPHLPTLDPACSSPCVLRGAHPALKHIFSKPASAWRRWVLLAIPAAGGGPSDALHGEKPRTRLQVTQGFSLHSHSARSQGRLPGRQLRWACWPQLDAHILVACCMPGRRRVGAVQTRRDPEAGLSSGVCVCEQSAPVERARTQGQAPGDLWVCPHLETATSQVWLR